MKKLSMVVALLGLLWMAQPPAEATFNPTFLKSIQQGTISIATSALSNTATVTAVTVTASAVMGTVWSAQSSSGTAHNGDLCNIVLTNSTTLTATRGALTGSGSNDAGCSVGYTLVEFLPQFVKARTTGVTGIGSTATTSAVTAGVVAKSMCFYGGLSEGSGGIPPGESFGACWVSSANVVTLKRGQVGDGAATMAWTVLEFK